MDITIESRPLTGNIPGIPSKSVLHRALICAALANGESRIRNVISSDDIEATLGTLNALGAFAAFDGDTIAVSGIGGAAGMSGPARLHCGESGSTLRFMIPVAAALGAEAVFEGGGRLPERPLGTYFDVLKDNGVEMTHPEGKSLPLGVKGRLRSGNYTISGAVSSQYITGLLLALPLCPGDSAIHVEEPFESRTYVDITISVMESFGVQVEQIGNTYHIKGGQEYGPRDYTAECDWSQAAFWLCAGAIGGDVAVSGMDMVSRQGDKAVVDLLRQFGAEVREQQDGSIRCSAGDLKSIEIDAAQIPDIVPVLAAVAAFAEGSTRIWNAGRLRFKESDRLESTADALSSIGAAISVECDELIIKGRDVLEGGTAGGHGDHRIVMALATAAAKCASPVTIKGYECVSKSYPHFFEDYKKLGGVIHGIDMG